jgi:UDP-3-O-[3-hydroxymyristoyl] glucosamine N-acyltransferase
MKISLNDIAKKVGGELSTPSEMLILAPSIIEEAKSGSITFFSNSRYEKYLYSTKASAVIVHKNFKPSAPVSSILMRVDNVNLAMSEILKMFSENQVVSGDISSTAIIDEESILDKPVSVGHYTTIGKRCKISKNTVLYNHVTIADDVEIGENCTIFPGVVIYRNTKIGNNCIIHANCVIGSDGFGFVPLQDGSFAKIPHVGNVIIEDDVEVGANTVIDRASIGSTIIHKGVKLDNLIQVAHNVEIGSNTAIAAQTGIAGSTHLGSNCLIGGQTGIAGHLRIEDRTMIQGKSGVTSNITEKGKKWYGYPAIDYQNYLKSYVYFKNFEKMVDKLRNLQKEIDLLKQQ